MKTVLYSLLGVALLATISSGTFLDFKNGQGNDLQAVSSNPYLTFIDDSLIDNLILQLQGQTDSAQLQIIQSFVYQQRKFFNYYSIMKILTVLKSSYSKQEYSIRSTAILVMKPYISPLSTFEATQILNMMNTFDGIACGILIAQVYDLGGNDENKSLLNNMVFGYYQVNIARNVYPQATKNFQSNFLMTFEGKHVGFLFDKSDSMKTIAYTNADGRNVTRYNMLEGFYYNNMVDIFQNFFQFSYLALGKEQGGCNTCSISDFNQIPDLNVYFRYPSQQGGSNDLYLKLSQITSTPYSTLSDLYILSDGLIPSGTQGVSDFIKLIDSINAQRRIKIRINTVSFLVGGKEDASARNAATTLLQILADYTNGTFIQVQPR